MKDIKTFRVYDIDPDQADFYPGGDSWPKKK